MTSTSRTTHTQAPTPTHTTTTDETTHLDTPAAMLDSGHTNKTLADGMMVIVREEGEAQLGADCPNCGEGVVCGHAVILPGDQPNTLLRDPHARCDRCGAEFIFEVEWSEEWGESAEATSERVPERGTL